MIGLLHDLDYEQYPEEHCRKTGEIWLPGMWIRVHPGNYEPRVWALHRCGANGAAGKTLYAVDELTGLINAVCLMRPSKSVLDLEVKSVKKKFKQPSFAAGVNREVIRSGCEMLGMELDEVIHETIKVCASVLRQSTSREIFSRASAPLWHLRRDT